METYRLFVSSPGDATIERRRVERVVSTLNGEFAGLARLETIRWESEHYRAHSTFQAQIPAAAECEIVVGILRWRLGSPLPDDFPERMLDGAVYPSGTAYEILTAIEKRKAGALLPDVFVFRYSGGGPSLGTGDYREIVRQWEAVGGFFARWFQTPEGAFKAAFNPYHDEDDFERRLEALLRKWLAARVAGGRVLVWGPDKGSPFRALNVFGARHAPVFFGRAADVRRTSEHLRESKAKFLLVIGASGAGKSSLMRAGLMPRLMTPGVVSQIDRWRAAAMRPGDAASPFAALAEALMQANPPPEEEGRGPALPELAGGDCRTPAQLAALLESGGSGATRPILAALDRIAARTAETERLQTPPRTGLLLLVDQLDELFAPSLTPETRTRFADVMAALVETGRVWLLTTLRADLYAALLEVSALKALKDAGAAYDLTPPGAAELAEIVRAPAEAAGLVFDLDAATGERLDERLLKEADRPDMLPLVQLALSRLWDRRESRGAETVLPLAAYEKLGGVKGIVDEAGETALASVGETERSRLGPLIRRLAETARGQALTARAASLAEAAPDDAARRLVDALVAARLLTLSGESGGASLRLAHQRVLSDWTRAARIVADSADFLRVSGEIEESRRRWEAGNRRAELLIPRGLPLAEAREMVARYGTESPKETLAYVEASQRRAGRQAAFAWILAIIFGVLAIGAVVAAVIAWDQRSVAERQTELARSNEREAVRQSAIAETQKAKADEKSAEAAEKAKLASKRGEEAQQQKEAAVKSAAEALAQQKIAESNQAAALAALAETRLQSDPEQTLKLALAAWPRDEKSPLQRSPFTFSLLQKAMSRQYARHVLQGHKTLVRDVEFSPDQSQFLTVDEDGPARSWDAVTGAPIQVFAAEFGPVPHAHYSPDGRLIVTAGNDGVARIWNAATGAEVKALSGHAKSLSNARFSPDGRRVLTASGDMTAILWDATTGARIATLAGHKDSLSDAAFSPDGARIVTVSGYILDNEDPAVAIWDGATGKNIAFIDKQPGGVRGVAFSPDGKSFVTYMGLADPGADERANSARIWNLGDGKLRAELLGQKQGVYSAVFSRDSRNVASAAGDGTVKLWNAQTGALLRTLQHGQDIGVTASFSPGGSRIVSAATDGSIKIWDTATGQLAAELKGHRGAVEKAIYANPPNRIVSVSADKTAIIWDATSFSAQRIVGDGQIPLSDGSFSVDGRKLVLAADNGAGVIYDLESSGVSQTENENTPVKAARLTPDGARLVTLSNETMTIWSVPEYKRIRSFEYQSAVQKPGMSADGKRLVADVNENDVLRVAIVDVATGDKLRLLDDAWNPTAAVAVSPDGQMIARASIESALGVWNAATGARIAKLEGHRSGVRDIVFSHDGKRLATASTDATVRLWDPTTGKQLAVLRGHASVAGVMEVEFSPDDRFVLTTSQQIRLYDASTGEQKVVIDKARGPAHFSPSGRFLVAGTGKGAVSIFDVATGTPVMRIQAHNGDVASASFAPDGKSLLTTGKDGYAKIWDLGGIPEASVFEIACRQLPDQNLQALAPTIRLGQLRPICTGVEPPPDGAELVAAADENRDSITSAQVAVYSGKFADAIDLARRTLLYGDDQAKTRARLVTAHALMLSDHTDEARDMYFAGQGKLIRHLIDMRNGDVKAPGGMTVESFERVALDDFTELRAAGLQRPLMDEIGAVFAKTLNRYEEATKNVEPIDQKYFAKDYANALLMYERALPDLELNPIRMHHILRRRTCFGIRWAGRGR